jgi:hypothetical protein
MRKAWVTSSALGLVLAAGGAGNGLAQSVGPVMNAPQFVKPQYAEVGIGVYVAPPASTATTGDTSSGDGSSGSTAAANGSSLSTLESEDYGSAAVADATNLNEDPNAMADFASVESNFENIGDAGGTTSATGPWQVTQGTFNYINQLYGLGLSPGDINNPTDEAEVAAYTIDNYAQQVETATNAPPTIVQTYGAYELGPEYGADIASAPSSVTLGSIVPASYLANNNIPPSTTVGQYYAEESAKLGATANNPVFG